MRLASAVEREALAEGLVGEVGGAEGGFGEVGGAEGGFGEVGGAEGVLVR